MKKIFAIIISLLFVVSVFGVASAMAGDPCKYEIIGPESVQVGDTFQVKLMQNGCCWGNNGGVKGALEQFCTQPGCEGYDIIPGGYLFTYKALKVGTYEKLFYVGCFEDERVYYGVTVTPREYPMFSFMKILGFGKNK
ncbi:MAG: hypothetical protein HPY60_01185 [Candidatus Methanofastidiosum sp.]|nr:hypothetical protein [Methanofastidiosum sp.]